MVPSDGLTIAIESNMFLSCPSCLIPVMSCLPCKAPSNHSCTSAPRTSRPCIQQDVPHQCPPPMSGPSKSYPAKRSPSSKPPPRISVEEQQPHIPAQEQNHRHRNPSSPIHKGTNNHPHRRKDGMPMSPQRHGGLEVLLPQRGRVLRRRPRHLPPHLPAHLDRLFVPLRKSPPTSKKVAL